MRNEIQNIGTVRFIVVALMSVTWSGNPTDAMAVQSRSTDIVQISDGPIRGLKTPEGVDMFLGIPFAAPPVRDLRWQPPRPPAPWTVPFNAVAYGNTCVQTNTSGGVFAAASDKEDCLYLNVFAPSQAAKSASPRPVMVWIYGGGFFEGQSNGHDGSKLVRDGDVVFVSMNYRLNIFGFMAHPGLEAEGHPSANYGLMDQQAALRWIRQNIGAFGGDPNNVTIFGESYGGTAVLFHMISPTAAGLFHRAIIQSPAFLPTQDTLAAAQTRGLEFGTALGCRDQTAACLRSKSVQEIIAKASTFVSGIPVQALDGTVLTRNMGEAFATGQFNKVPVIMGTNLDERTWFIGQTELASHVPLSTAAYPAQLGGGRNAALIQAEYPLSRYRNPSEALSAATTDSRFACGTRRGLRLLTQQVPT